jgi:type II secretory pathway pseudopilin PulG
MSVKRCPQCKLVNWATEYFCKRCGQDLQVIDVLQTAKAETYGAAVEQIQSPNQFQTKPVSPETHQFSGDFNRQQHASNFHDGFRPENPSLNSPQWNNQYSGYQTSQGYQRQNPQTKKGMAIASLIFGILGFPFVSIILGGIISIFLGIIFGTTGAVFGITVFLLMIPLGLILGIVAVVRANKMPSVYGGKSIAITGIIFSSCGILLLPVFGIIGAIAVPNVIEARKAANEGSAINGLRMIIVAEETYKAENLRCGDLQALGKENLIDTRLVKGEVNGYRFMIVNLPTMNGDCAITATPTTALDGARAFYYSTEDGLIRARKYEGKPAGPTDEPIKITTPPGNQPF